MHRPIRTRYAGLLVPTVLLAGFALLIQGCEQQTGIFADIERETEIANRNLSKTAGVSGVAKLGDSYYANLGSIWKLTLTDGDSTNGEWTPTDLPEGLSESTVLGMAVVHEATDEPRLYASFSDSSGEPSGLYHRDADNDSWTNVEKEGGYSGPVTTLFAFDTDDNDQNDQLVALSPEDGSSNVFSLVFDPEGPGSTKSITVNAVIDAAYLSGDNEYWFLSKNYLYRGTGAGDVVRVDLSSAFNEEFADVSGFAGIYSRDGDIYVATQSGDVHRRINGSWKDKVTLPGDPTPTPADLTVVTELGQSGADGTLYVAARSNESTTGGGYFTASPAGTVTPSRPDADDSYTSADLSEAEILGFHVFDQSFSGTDGRFLFARTANSGLWSKEITAEGPQDWRWE